jgi:hypothetical protein
MVLYKVTVSDRHKKKKQKFGKGHSNDHSFSLGSVSSLVSEKKIFEISANQSILLALAAMAGLSLTLDPMGKMFQNPSSLKPLGQLKPNCPVMIIGKSSVLYTDRKSKMAATTGHSINTGPYGENTEIYSSLKLLH